MSDLQPEHPGQEAQQDAAQGVPTTLGTSAQADIRPFSEATGPSHSSEPIGASAVPAAHIEAAGGIEADPTELPGNADADPNELAGHAEVDPTELADDQAAHPRGTTLADRPGEWPGPGETDSGLPPLRAALEAVLLVTDEPVPAVTLAQVTERPTGEVEQTLIELVADYESSGRGFELRNVAGGWRLYTRADCAPYVERFVLDGQSARLTQAALETLAVIAYRQPVTRGRVSAVRGVNVDGVIRTLLARGLIAEYGQDAETGGLLYRTTPMLLERLGLRSLDELPSLAPLLPELEELESVQPST